MANRTPTEQRLFEYVQQFAHPSSDYQIAVCWRRCDDHNHELIGPVLQYKVDNYNLGRWIVLCHGRHPGDRKQPGPQHKAVSQALSVAARRQIAAWRAENGIQANGKPVPKSKKAKARESGAAENQATSEVIDLTLDTIPTPPAQSHSQATRTRSPSVEITRVVPAPVLFGELEVLYFSDDKKVPTTFTLKARPARSQFRLRQYADLLHAVEIKQTDLIMVLTTVTGKSRTWSSFRVSDLAIPRTQPKLLLSRRCVVTPHDCINLYHDYAYPGAAQLPDRITPLP
ncbi:hypothetical protein PENSPDRAFT_664727 [Peniophora sp. CONT]|nr:hypothetical protein PENSPDRAFT_664727 [Peniophora sp. CONT]